MNLSYFIPSLPMLSQGRAPELTADEFLALCDSQLSAPLARAARALVEGTDDGHPFVREWRDLDSQIRNAVAAERAKRRGLSPAETPRRPVSGCDASIAPAVAAAFALPDPLRRERAIDALRWSAIESIQGVEPISERTLLAYAAKLPLAIRSAAMGGDGGEAAFISLTRR